MKRRTFLAGLLATTTLRPAAAPPAGETLPFALPLSGIRMHGQRFGSSGVWTTPQIEECNVAYFRRFLLKPAAGQV